MSHRIWRGRHRRPVCQPHVRTYLRPASIAGACPGSLQARTFRATMVQKWPERLFVCAPAVLNIALYPLATLVTNFLIKLRSVSAFGALAAFAADFNIKIRSVLCFYDIAAFFAGLANGHTTIVVHAGSSKKTAHAGRVTLGSVYPLRRWHKQRSLLDDRPYYQLLQMNSRVRCGVRRRI